jgi:hypothetical protein
MAEGQEVALGDSINLMVPEPQAGQKLTRWDHV